MDQRHREIIRRHRISLVRALDTVDICDGLLSKGVFTQDMVDEIQSKETRRDRARALLIDLETRGSRAFRSFLECLRETRYQDLADLLDGPMPVHRPVLTPPRVVPLRPEPLRPEPLRPEPMRPEPLRPEPLRPEPMRPEPLKPVPLRPETLPVPNPISPPSETNEDYQKPNRKRRDSIQTYKMDAKPCGNCLIINNVEFESGSDLSSRKGSNIDCDKMEKRFKALNFEVDVKRNLKCRHIRHEMSSLSKKDHSQYDCCVVIILSHGTEASHNCFPGAIYGVDGKAVPVQIITSYLNGHNCPSLQGKPKLFFIQACGGDEKDIGFEVSPDEMQPSMGGANDEMDAIPMSFSSDSLNTPDEVDARATLPTPSDMLVSYSTFPGYVSWRDPEAGSWYVENLERVLEQNADTDDLVTMLMMVNDAVSQISAKGLYKQMPGSFNFLRKLLFFRMS